MHERSTPTRPAAHSDKPALRRHLLAIREARSARARTEAAAAITRHLLALTPSLDSVSCVASYESWPSEPDTAELNFCLQTAGVRVLVPTPHSGHPPAWLSLAGRRRLLGRSATLLDQAGSPERFLGALSEADVIVLPALAVDEWGTRLGRGGGWYDRALVAANPEAPRVALVFSEEFFPGRWLPSEPHDQPVTAVATPAGVFQVGSHCTSPNRRPDSPQLLGPERSAFGGALKHRVPGK